MRIEYDVVNVERSGFCASIVIYPVCKPHV